MIKQKASLIDAWEYLISKRDNKNRIKTTRPIIKNRKRKKTRTMEYAGSLYDHMNSPSKLTDGGEILKNTVDSRSE